MLFTLFILFVGLFVSNINLIDSAIEYQKRKIKSYMNAVVEEQDILARCITVRNALAFEDAQIDGIVKLCLTGE